MDAFSEFRRTSVINALRSCQLFAGLPTADLRGLAGLAIVKRLAKGDYLFHQGDASLGFFVVQSGSLNVHRISPAGKEQVIHVFRPGASFAEATLVSETGYPAEARALEASQVLMIPKNEFIALVRRQPELALRMLAAMSLHLRVLVGLLDDLTLKDVETRLANWLLQRCPQPPDERPFRFELPLTKRVLAAELGTVSETLSRTLAKLREQQLIEVHGKSVVVVSPRRLAALLRRNRAELSEGQTHPRAWTD